MNREVHVPFCEKLAGKFRRFTHHKAHYVLDVTYKEDDSRIRRENAAENIAIARRFALNLARLHPQKNSMKGKLKQAMWSDDFRDQIILGHNVNKV